MAIAVSFLFCSFGVDSDVDGSSIYLAGSGLLIFAMACHAYFFCSWFVGFAALPMVWIFASQLLLRLGSGLHDGSGPSELDHLLTQAGATGIVAAVWIAIDWLSIRFKRIPMGRPFFWMPNLVVLLGSLLVFCRFSGCHLSGHRIGDGGTRAQQVSLAGDAGSGCCLDRWILESQMDSFDCLLV